MRYCHNYFQEFHCFLKIYYCLLIKVATEATMCAGLLQLIVIQLHDIWNYLCKSHALLTEHQRIKQRTPFVLYYLCPFPSYADLLALNQNENGYYVHYITTCHLHNQLKINV